MPTISTNFDKSSFHPIIFLRRATALSVIGLVAGCAGQHVTETGFLPNYGAMQHTPGHSDDLIYVAPQLAQSRYDKVMVAPVAWRPVKGAAHLTPAQIDRMSTAFRDDIVKALSPHYTIIDGSDCGDCAGVIKVAAAITDLRRSQWYYNAVPMVVGMGAAAAGGMAPPIPPPAPGGASEELMATDARTGDVLVEVATYNNGMPWNFMGQWLPYGHAKRAFSLSSKLLATELTKANAQVAAAN
ncbi:DUF3313 family protein [Acidisoma silvae]|uniref:DUF3313 family protein n=1 Tax=Acidisoma silvae TaxID=2802396 RepID=A0A964E008_9PROT|nr:DUF3313 family protein [Acidisoma silvae]MCB8876659.1 DUF3313 family protein [Acidisoma silvae]